MPPEICPELKYLSISETGTYEVIEQAAKHTSGDPYPWMYVCIAMSDPADPMTIGTKEPTIILGADSLQSLPIGTKSQSITDAQNNRIFRVQLIEKVRDVYLIEVLIYQPNDKRTWRVSIKNEDNKPRNFVCVVADNKDESYQSWIDLPSQLDFGVVGREAPSQPVSKNLSIINRGTGNLAVDIQAGKINNKGFAIKKNLVASISPNSRNELEVEFIPGNRGEVINDTFTMNTKSVALKAVVAGITEASGLTPKVRQGDTNLSVNLQGYGLMNADTIIFKHAGLSHSAVTGSVDGIGITVAGDLYTVPVTVSVRDDALADDQWTFALSGKVDGQICTIERGNVSFAVEERSVSGLAQKSGQQGDVIDTTISGENLEGVTEVELLDPSGKVVQDLTIAKNGDFVSGRLPVRIMITDLATPGQRDFKLQVKGDRAGRTWCITKQQTFDVIEIQTAVNSINPTDAIRGDSIQLTISGQRLKETEKVTLVKAAPVTLPASNIPTKIVSQAESAVSVTFTIPDEVEAGDYDLLLTMKSGEGKNAKKTFKVEAGVPSIQKITPDKGRQGRTIRILISGKNLENTETVNTSPYDLFVTPPFSVHPTPTTVEAVFIIPNDVEVRDHDLHAKMNGKDYAVGVKFQVLRKSLIDKITSSRPIRPGYTEIPIEITGQGLDDPIDKIGQSTDKILFRYKSDNSQAKVSAQILEQTEAKIKVAISVADDAMPGSCRVEIITEDGHSIENRDLTLLIDEKPKVDVLLSDGKLLLEEVQQCTKDRPFSILGKGLSDFDHIEVLLSRWRVVHNSHGLGGISPPIEFPIEKISEPDPNITITIKEWNDREIKATLTVQPEAMIDESIEGVPFTDVNHTIRLVSSKYGIRLDSEVQFRIIKGPSVTSVVPDKVEIRYTHYKLLEKGPLLFRGIYNWRCNIEDAREIEELSPWFLGFKIIGDNFDKRAVVSLSDYGDFDVSFSSPQELTVTHDLFPKHLPRGGEHSLIIKMPDYVELSVTINIDLTIDEPGWDDCRIWRPLKDHFQAPSIDR